MSESFVFSPIYSVLSLHDIIKICRSRRNKTLKFICLNYSNSHNNNDLILSHQKKISICFFSLEFKICVETILKTHTDLPSSSSVEQATENLPLQVTKDRRRYSSPLFSLVYCSLYCRPVFTLSSCPILFCIYFSSHQQHWSFSE